MILKIDTILCRCFLTAHIVKFCCTNNTPYQQQILTLPKVTCKQGLKEPIQRVVNV